MSERCVSRDSPSLVVLRSLARNYQCGGVMRLDRRVQTARGKVELLRFFFSLLAVRDGSLLQLGEVGKGDAGSPWP